MGKLINKGTCSSPSSKRAETNPVTHCGTAALLYVTRIHLLKDYESHSQHTLSHSQMGHSGGDDLYLKWIAGLQVAVWQTGHREQGEVHRDALAAPRKSSVLSLLKDAKDIDRVSPYKLVLLPGSAVKIRGGLMAQVNRERPSVALLRLQRRLVERTSIKDLI